MHRSTITTSHSRTNCYRLALVTSLFFSTLLYDVEFVRSQDYLQFSNSSSLIADKSRFFLPNSPASSSFNENNKRNSSSSLVDGRDPLTESLLSSRESSNSFHDTAAVDVPLLREPRQFVYDANPWSSSASAGAGSGNLLNVNSNSRNSGSRNEFNSNSRSSSVPGDVRRSDNTQPSQRRNGSSRSASSSSQPASSPWDTDNNAYEGSGLNAAGSSQQSNINYSPRNGASSAGNGDHWPQTSSTDNQRSSSSHYDRNNRQRYPSSSQVRPSASSYSPQNTSPWGSSETTGSRSGAGANAAAGGTTEDDEDDEWDNVEGSGDTAHDQTDPFDTASGAGGRSPTSSSANNGFNLVGQPPSTSANDNWQLPSSNSRPGEDRNRQPVGGDNANNYDSSLTSGARIPSPVLRKDESRTSSGQQYPSGAGYDDSNNYHENFDERNNNDNPNPSWGQSPYDELPSSSSSTTLMPIALPPAVGPGASGGGIISSNTADEGDGEDEDSTIKPVEIPTNTVYRGSEGTAKTDGGDASRRPFSSQRPNNTTGDLVAGGVGGANGTGIPPTTETPQPPSWAWLSAMALQFFDSFWQKMTEEPGLLAAVIGGAVIGLLCAILLAMFLIYRMRKKDEGSYALDESTVYRKPGGYMRAPTSEVTAKEYYA